MGKDYRWTGIFECSITPKEHVSAMYELLERLDSKCKSSIFFEGEKPDRVWIYKLNDESFSTPKGPAMLAIAKFGDINAVMAPDYLDGKQWLIVDYLIEKFTDRPKGYVVFSRALHRRFFTAGYRGSNVYLCE